jgi:hypothetical protein
MSTDSSVDLKARLEKAREERSDEYGEIWKKGQTPEIEGRVIRVDERADQDKPDEAPFKIIEIEDRDGTRTSIFANATVLRREVERTQPRVGDWLSVGYLGLQPGRDGGNSWGDYIAIVDRHQDTPAPDEADAGPRVGDDGEQLEGWQP